MAGEAQSSDTVAVAEPLVLAFTESSESDVSGGTFVTFTITLAVQDEVNR